jgi:hypothetical protein
LPPSNAGDDEMRDTIDMAETISHGWWLDDEKLKAFAELVRADERWEQSKRRGVLAFCPYTGKPRHPSDIASDPHGILILVPDQPLQGMKP